MLFQVFFQVCATSLLAAGSVLPSLRPLVLWHGLGDSHSSPGMLEFMKLIGEVHPGIFIHSIYIYEDQGEDRKAGFYGNINEQLEIVTQQLVSIPELQRGFDAVGFSQGGQFLRAYVERYNNPAVHNLITFGSQHMGISDLPLCGPYDLLCQMARVAVRKGVYTAWVQNNLIQAQYYRDPHNYESYLRANHFLPWINNEVEDGRNKTYARNLASLDNLVLVMFTEDKMVVPKESAWFGSEAIEDESRLYPWQHRFAKTIVPMWEQRLYIEDWIGLRELDEQGKIVLTLCNGEHMQIGGCWRDLIVEYTGH